MIVGLGEQGVSRLLTLIVTNPALHRDGRCRGAAGLNHGKLHAGDLQEL